MFLRQVDNEANDEVADGAIMETLAPSRELSHRNPPTPSLASRDTATSTLPWVEIAKENEADPHDTFPNE